MVGFLSANPKPRFAFHPMTLSGEDLDTSPELAAEVGCCRLEIGERIVGYFRCPDRAIVQGLASAGCPEQVLVG